LKKYRKAKFIETKWGVVMTEKCCIVYSYTDILADKLN